MASLRAKRDSKRRMSRWPLRTCGTTSVPLRKMGSTRRSRWSRKEPATPSAGVRRSSVPRVRSTGSTIFSVGTACAMAAAGTGSSRKSKKPANSRRQVERRLCSVACRVCTEKNAIASMRRRTSGSSRSSGAAGCRSWKRCRKRSSPSSSDRKSR